MVAPERTIRISFARPEELLSREGSCSEVALRMSVVGQNRKSSMRAHVFRFAPKSGHCATESACPFRATTGPTSDAAFEGRIVKVALFIGTIRYERLPLGWSKTDEFGTTLRTGAQSTCSWRALEWLDIIIVQRHRISSLNCRLNVTMDHQSVISTSANEQELGPYTLQRGG